MTIYCLGNTRPYYLMSTAISVAVKISMSAPNCKTSKAKKCTGTWSLRPDKRNFSKTKALQRDSLEVLLFFWLYYYPKFFYGLVIGPPPPPPPGKLLKTK